MAHELSAFRPPPRPSPILDGLDDKAAEFARASKSANTARSYGRAWRLFVSWCDGRSESPLPASPEAVANYVASRATSGRRPATIQVDVAAIRQAHVLAGERPPTDDPKVSAVLSGVRRLSGVRPDAKEAMTPEHLAAFVSTAGPGLAGARDRAMILLGFAGAFRRNELVSLAVEDVTFTRGDEAVIVRVGRSKTDQDGRGLEKVVHATRGPCCPVAALRAWLSASGLSSGPLFRPVRGDRVLADRHLRAAAVADLVKKAAAASGLDVARFAGHSLRSGFVTAAADAGVPLADIMGVTHHRRADTALGYVRRSAGSHPSLSGKIGL